MWVAGWPVRSLLIVGIRVYRLTLGGIVGGQCRFYPSCSVYAERAIRARGAVLGVALAAWRILRCSPLSRGGVDHAPAARDGVPLYDTVILGESGVRR
jgi:putative membrane protein insertion efficiency factor